MRPLRRWLAVAACVLGAPAAQAQSIANTGDLSFGSFVAGSGGTIAVTTGGGRTKTGGVMLVAQGGGSTAAQFSVSGTAAATYAITLPANDTVTLSDGNSHTMAVNSFVSSPSATGTLSGGGTQSLSVGATLTVGNAQPPGSYAGSFPVTVSYN
ncbi:MAG: DUF4402 domain-containing protein [Xanthomonadaceae bacterium]|nr:DUF4402 domain-containing protein [Xanthomonadaceae bacterium]